MWCAVALLTFQTIWQAYLSTIHNPSARIFDGNMCRHSRFEIFVADNTKKYKLIIIKSWFRLWREKSTSSITPNDLHLRLNIVRKTSSVIRLQEYDIPKPIFDCRMVQAHSSNRIVIPYEQFIAFSRCLQFFLMSLNLLAKLLCSRHCVPQNIVSSAGFRKLEKVGKHQYREN